jgi:cell division protein FtsI/penicillin-binding protein 2
VLKQAKAPRGAVVVTALDGRILAYAGRRTEDPKGGKDGIVDPTLLTTAWAPAASIVKIATAAALVDAGVGPHDEVCYHGGLRSVMKSNLEDSRQDNRCNDLAYGLAHSQNAIIAKLVHKHLEPAQLRTTAEALGFGGALPAWSMGGDSGRIEVPDAKGVDFGKTAAGFDGSWLSPVGGAIMANTFATGGMAATPRLVAAVIDKKGRRTELDAAPARRVLSADTATAVAAMMVQTCDSGSAAKAFRGKGGLPRSTKVAGKTGTLSLTSPFYLQYSWFVGFAPADQPEVSIAVILGNTDLWWLKAHTAARMVLAEALADGEH